MIVAWVAFPLVLGLLALGTGLLVERVAGFRMPGTLLIPLGFAGLVGATQLTTLPGWLAPATPWIALVLAIAGFVVGRRRTVDPWAAAMAAGVFVIYALPTVLTGHATFLGYQNLGDAAIHFELADRVMGHGASVAGLAPSSYQLSLFSYIGTSYPTGGHTVLGAARALVGTDVAWVFAPYIATLAAIVALALLTVVRSLTQTRWLAAVAAGLAALASLTYSYAQDQQAIKEMATLATLFTLVALVQPTLAATPRWRAAIPLAVAAGGALGVLSVAVAPWAGPALLIALAALVVRHRRLHARALGGMVVTFVVLGGVLALPVLSRLGSFVATNKVTLQAVQEIGNLGEPLDFVRALGVWPARDFRLPVPTDGLAVLLVGVAALLAVIGFVVAVRRRAWPVLLLVAVSLIGFAVVAGRASPWAYGKALMLLSPVAVLLATAAVAEAWDRRRRVEAGVLALALAGGVLWTDARTYNGVDPAPTERLGELRTIGERFAGQGPLIYFEFEEYAKHFLRQTDPTGAVESFRPDVLDGSAALPIVFGFSSDPDAYTAESLQAFKLMVLRKGPTMSRPPSGWRRVFSGTSYDVWRRDAGPSPVLRHQGTGTRLDAAASPPCEAIEDLAGVARRAGGRLAYVPRDPVPAFLPAAAPRLPGQWSIDTGDEQAVRVDGRGSLDGQIVVPRAGTYRLWLEASMTRPVTVRIGSGRPLELHPTMNPRRSVASMVTVRLPAGTLPVHVDVPGGSLAPGDGGRNRILGPIYLTPTADPAAAPIRTVDASRWRSLCGRTVDWVEAVR